MTDYYCPKCGEHPQFIIQNPATGKPHCHSCGVVLEDARAEHERQYGFDE